MKRIIIGSLFTLLISIAIITTIHHTKAASPQTVSQKYTVTSVHSDYIEVESNKTKGEYINLYYADQTKKQSFNVNDKVVAYFKPYKGSYQILDFKKIKQKLTTYDYVITSIQADGIHGKSLKDNTGIYLTQDNVKGLNLSVKDSIRVSFPNDQWDVITNVEKVRK